MVHRLYSRENQRPERRSAMILYFLLGTCLGGTLACIIAALLNIIGEEDDDNGE